MTKPIISSIDSDEISVNQQLINRLEILSDYVKGRVKTCKGMDDNECQRLIESLAMLKDEVYYWF